MSEMAGPARARAEVAGLLQVLCSRQALLEVVMSKMYLVLAIMASLQGSPPDEWRGALAVLCLSAARAALGGLRSPRSGGLASRRTIIMYIQGSLLSLSICGGYAYLFLNVCGYAEGPPDRMPFGGITLLCQMPSTFLSCLWVFTCFSRQEAMTREKPMERILASLSQVETFALCPDSPGTWDSPCVICLDDFAEGCEVGKLPCSHAFHDACIRKWLGSRDRCPMRCSIDHCTSVLGRSAEP
jgi:hypothetical protein